MADDVQILGLAEVERALHEMGEKVAKKALTDALDYAGNVLQLAQVETAPIGEGSTEHPVGMLKSDIRRVIQVKPAECYGIVSVGPSKHSNYYGRFHEFGTSHEPARPWMRPAFQASSQEAFNVFCEVLAAYIEDFANKRK